MVNAYCCCWIDGAIVSPDSINWSVIKTAQNFFSNHVTNNGDFVGTKSKQRASLYNRREAVIFGGNASSRGHSVQGIDARLCNYYVRVFDRLRHKF
jgi:hypothetical protein